MNHERRNDMRAEMIELACQCDQIDSIPEIQALKMQMIESTLDVHNRKNVFMIGLDNHPNTLQILNTVSVSVYGKMFIMLPGRIRNMLSVEVDREITRHGGS